MQIRQISERMSRASVARRERPVRVHERPFQAGSIWSDLLSGADMFDKLSVILVRAMSRRPDSGNALPLHLRDRHQHTFV
jgi:hypothetical protein